jgi:hypothetical protein
MSDRRQSCMDMARRAAGILEQRGWCQGDFKDDRGALDLSAAIYEASTQVGSTFQGGIDLRRAVVILTGETPVKFNDHPARRRKDVVEVLLRISGGEGVEEACSAEENDVQ